jgi:hemerythrin-like domain-containing protein
MPAFPSSFPDLRAQVQAQVDFLNQVAHHAVDTVEQLSDLNLRTARQMSGEGWRSWQGALMKMLTPSGAPHLIQSHRGEPMSSTGTAQNGPPDALALLRADHQQLRLLFARCENLRGLEDAEETLAELVDDLCDALIVHTMLEEELFYPALRAASGDDELFDDAELEHAGARELISQLEVMYPGDEHFEATLAVLAEEVAHHIAQEESEMFELARAAGVDLFALGQRLALRQAELEEDMSAPPTAFDAAMPHDGRRTPPRAPD